MPQKNQKTQWKFNEEKLTIEEGEFDYDLAALSVGEEEDEEQKHILRLGQVKQTSEDKFSKVHMLDKIKLQQERLKVF